jgi:hypothetical protein
MQTPKQSCSEIRIRIKFYAGCCPCDCEAVRGYTLASSVLQRGMHCMIELMTPRKPGRFLGRFHGERKEGLDLEGRMAFQYTYLSRKGQSHASHSSGPWHALYLLVAEVRRAPWVDVASVAVAGRYGVSTAARYLSLFPAASSSINLSNVGRGRSFYCCLESCSRVGLIGLCNAMLYQPT